MEIKLIIPPNFYIADETASPPLQFEPFYNYADIDFVHLQRGDSFDTIPEAEMYGISAYTPDIKVSNQIARFLKLRDPKCKIAIGGYHATYQTADIDDIYDYVVVGHGEKFIENIVNDTLLEDRYFIDSSKRIEYNKRAYKHFARYNPCHHYENSKGYTIRTSYGCYWNCRFCVSHNGVLFRKAAEIERQLDFLRENGVGNIRIIDDIFTEHPEFPELCKLLSDFKWMAQTRIERLADENVKRMTESGCYGFQVGIESFDSQVREKLNKKLTDKQIRDGMAITKNYGLDLYCFIILGTPFDTTETIKSTVGKCNYYSGVAFRPLIFCPFPGTAIGDNPSKYNTRLLTKQYEYYTTIPFQNIHGRVVSVPNHVQDVDSWETLLRKSLYELNTPIVKGILDNPLTEWHTNYA
ncbi:B12-binding domain-containing radical SAM protein [bacterium]|nr:B12-binding domain-containing radical SAM protein [bacterium]